MSGTLKRLLALCLLCLGTPTLPAAPALTEGVVGDPLPVIEKDRFSGTKLYDRDGDRIRIDFGEDMPRDVRLLPLTEREATEIWRQVGGELTHVKSPRDAKRKVPPFYPYQLRRRHETASVKCLFEVKPDGTVGRIFRVGEGSDIFFKECVRALSGWRFKPQPQGSFRAAEFEGRTEKP